MFFCQGNPGETFPPTKKKIEKKCVYPHESTWLKSLSVLSIFSNLHFQYTVQPAIGVHWMNPYTLYGTPPLSSHFYFQILSSTPRMTSFLPCRRNISAPWKEFQCQLWVPLVFCLFSFLIRTKHPEFTFGTTLTSHLGLCSTWKCHSRGLLILDNCTLALGSLWLGGIT